MTFRYSVLILMLLINSNILGQSDSLDHYINRLKHSQSVRGAETAFLSVGSDFMSAQEYFESGNFSSAEYSFRSVVRSHPDHAYANYQLAVALLKQNDKYKTKEAQGFLSTAFRLQPTLETRYNKDFSGKPSVTEVSESHGLEGYVEKIKYSRATGGKDTEMLSAGNEAFYAIEYYEAGDYGSANSRFTLSLAVDADNPYVNYMNAVSLSALGKTSEAKIFASKAFDGDPELKERYQKDAAKATASWKKHLESKKVKSTTSVQVKYGGSLVYGNYTCHVSVWNGPNVSPAYRYDYKGYFQLRNDGTYRWLDDGGTGKYTYNSSTGSVTWLSGPMKSEAPKSSKYQSGKVPQITVTFSDTYRWECGCKK